MQLWLYSFFSLSLLDCFPSFPSPSLPSWSKESQIWLKGAQVLKRSSLCKWTPQTNLLLFLVHLFLGCCQAIFCAAIPSLRVLPYNALIFFFPADPLFVYWQQKNRQNFIPLHFSSDQHSPNVSVMFPHPIIAISSVCSCSCMFHFTESCRDIIVLFILSDFECITGNRELKLHLDFMQIPNDPGPPSHTPLPIHTSRCFSLCIVSHFCSGFYCFSLLFRWNLNLCCTCYTEKGFDEKLSAAEGSWLMHLG